MISVAILSGPLGRVGGKEEDGDGEWADPGSSTLPASQPHTGRLCQQFPPLPVPALTKARTQCKEGGGADGTREDDPEGELDLGQAEGAALRQNLQGPYIGRVKAPRVL